jgi:hypothetical protein
MKNLPHVGAIRLGQLYTVGLTGQRCEVLGLSPAFARVKLLDLGKVVDLPISQLRPLPTSQ